MWPLRERSANDESLVWRAASLAGVGRRARPSACRSTPTPVPDELRNIFTFQVENDVFNRIGKSDRDYTNGLRFGWLSPALPDLPDGVWRR